MIDLPHCRFELTPTGYTTDFRDGTRIESRPDDTHHHYVIAHRCGYSDDILAYCREHDFFHIEMTRWLNKHQPIALFLPAGLEIKILPGRYEWPDAEFCAA